MDGVEEAETMLPSPVSLASPMRDGVAVRVGDEQGVEGGLKFPAGLKIPSDIAEGLKPLILSDTEQRLVISKVAVVYIVHINKNYSQFFCKLKDIRPAFHLIAKLSLLLFLHDAEKELQRIRDLKKIRQTLQLQYDGLQYNIFILSPNEVDALNEIILHHRIYVHGILTVKLSTLNYFVFTFFPMKKIGFHTLSSPSTFIDLGEMDPSTSSNLNGPDIDPRLFPNVPREQYQSVIQQMKIVDQRQQHQQQQQQQIGNRNANTNAINLPNNVIQIPAHLLPAISEAVRRGVPMDSIIDMIRQGNQKQLHVPSQQQQHQPSSSPVGNHPHQYQHQQNHRDGQMQQQLQYQQQQLAVRPLGSSIPTAAQLVPQTNQNNISQQQLLSSLQLQAYVNLLQQQHMPLRRQPGSPVIPPSPNLHVNQMLPVGMHSHQRPYPTLQVNHPQQQQTRLSQSLTSQLGNMVSQSNGSLPALLSQQILEQQISEMQQRNGQHNQSQHAIQQQQHDHNHLQQMKIQRLIESDTNTRSPVLSPGRIMQSQSPQLKSGQPSMAMHVTSQPVLGVVHQHIQSPQQQQSMVNDANRVLQRAQLQQYQLQNMVIDPNYMLQLARQQQLQQQSPQTNVQGSQQQAPVNISSPPTASTTNLEQNNANNNQTRSPSIQQSPINSNLQATMPTPSTSQASADETEHQPVPPPPVPSQTLVVATTNNTVNDTKQLVTTLQTSLKQLLVVKMYYRRVCERDKKPIVINSVECPYHDKVTSGVGTGKKGRLKGSKAKGGKEKDVAGVDLMKELKPVKLGEQAKRDVQKMMAALSIPGITNHAALSNLLVVGGHDFNSDMQLRLLKLKTHLQHITNGLRNQLYYAGSDYILAITCALFNLYHEGMNILYKWELDQQIADLKSDVIKNKKMETTGDVIDVLEKFTKLELLNEDPVKVLFTLVLSEGENGVVKEKMQAIRKEFHMIPQLCLLLFLHGGLSKYLCDIRKLKTARLILQQQYDGLEKGHYVLVPQSIDFVRAMILQIQTYVQNNVIKSGGERPGGSTGGAGGAGGMGN
ncbi:hypothetical protein HDU76_005071 [Blyttiomyces sp. JEL0837]|nr:hypothetical protein HDU76_005071 [Blyttiomyces sp. JEL0837]